MKDFYARLERLFEKITFAFTAVISNSITFILALVMVVFWLSNRNYLTDPINENIRDIIHGVSFLTLFVIQRAFNHFMASLHIKLNELISSHETASNAILNIESKTETEIVEIQKEYDEIAKKSFLEDDEQGEETKS